MKFKKILPFIIIVLIIVGLVVVRRVVTKLSVIPENAPGMLGNTPGNLYNGGLFCETDTGVFFSNAYDGGALYFWGNDGSMKKVAEGNITHINAAGDYIYYYTAETSSGAGLGYVRGGRGIYRASINGKNDTILVHGTSDSVMLLGSELYYTFFGETDNKDNAEVSVQKISINGGDTQSVLEEHIVLGAAEGQTIYYGGIKEDHHLYALDTLSGVPRKVLPQNVYLPIVSGGIVYYIDITDDYKLKSCRLSDGTITTIVEERIDSYNMLGDMIYFQNCDKNGYALKRVHTDGSNMEVVFEGVTTGISCTKNYTYFTVYGADVPVYRTPTFGNVNVTTFAEALEAAKASVK